MTYLFDAQRKSVEDAPCSRCRVPAVTPTSISTPIFWQRSAVIRSWAWWIVRRRRGVRSFGIRVSAPLAPGEFIYRAFQLELWMGRTTWSLYGAGPELGRRPKIVLDLS